MPIQVPQQINWVGQRAIAVPTQPLVLPFGDKRFTVDPACERLHDIAALYRVLDKQMLRSFLDAIPQAHLQSIVVFESSEATLTMNYGQFLKFAIATFSGCEDFPVPAFVDQPIVEKYTQAPVIKLVHPSVEKLMRCYMHGANPPSQYHLRLVMGSLLERLKKVQNILDSGDPRPIEVGSVNAEINTLLKVASHSYPGTPPADLMWLSEPPLHILIGALKGESTCSPPSLVGRWIGSVGLINFSWNVISDSKSTMTVITKSFSLSGHEAYLRTIRSHLSADQI